MTGFGYEFGFSPISKHGYGTGKGHIDTHPEPIPKFVPNVEIYFMFICHVILFDNCRVIKLSLIFKGATKSIGLTNVKMSILLDNALQHFSRGCKKNFYFLLKKIIQCGDEVGIPEPIGDGDEVQFLILIGYG